CGSTVLPSVGTVDDSWTADAAGAAAEVAGSIAGGVVTTSCLASSASAAVARGWSAAAVATSVGVSTISMAVDSGAAGCSGECGAAASGAIVSEGDPAGRADFG